MNMMMTKLNLTPGNREEVREAVEVLRASKLRSVEDLHGKKDANSYTEREALIDRVCGLEALLDTLRKEEADAELFETYAFSMYHIAGGGSQVTYAPEGHKEAGIRYYGDREEVGNLALHFNEAWNASILPSHRHGEEIFVLPYFAGGWTAEMHIAFA